MKCAVNNAWFAISACCRFYSCSAPATLVSVDHRKKIDILQALGTWESAGIVSSELQKDSSGHWPTVSTAATQQKMVLQYNVSLNLDVFIYT